MMMMMVVVIRCECNGHADTCDASSRPYTCHCNNDSFTAGRKVGLQIADDTAAN